ncbi:MAG: Rieske 2Fe-2S domain-containing protein [Nitrososphaerales archaeon]
MTFKKVCKSIDVKDNSMYLFNVKGIEITVGKHDGKLFACDAHCPHRGAYLHRGSFNDNNIVCPRHHYEFDLTSGKLVKMTSWKENNPTWIEQNPNWRRSGDLTIYKVKVSNGYVLVDLP